ncbi:uncharacterized protein LOC122289110 [Carya illinoinensis]|uniref:DUF4378 domain-containing protein n=1 Tax=Carya illinoinensis TaxID=32201 RepID=A0A8T1NYV5_CARIL|nr:uncharacterized protein LOC122289110 [Carya illinoinensis]KAG6634143.1 hypothetical protein CIPAW_12G098800 [Carya illinoinensis]
MASTAPSGDQKLRKPITIQRRPFMLKDYLRDDLLSSCSSSGFKSFPRRQCCMTVRFLLEVDLEGNKKQRLLRRNRSKVAASTTMSALQRASKEVISAFKKQLPLRFFKSPSLSPSVRNIGRKETVPISLWRKLFFRHSFWRKVMYKGEGGIRRWRLFREMNNEKDKKPDQDTHDSSTTRVGRRVLSSGNKWAETQSEFTNSETIRSCSGKSESSSENDVADGKSDLPENTDSNKLCETVGEDSISGAMATTCYGANTKEWPNEEKEQFSPVSVLDFPFEDDEHTQHLDVYPTCIEGTKQKRMHKIRQCLTQIEAVNLEKRIELSEPNHEAPKSLEQSCSIPTLDNKDMLEDKEDEQIKENAQELFHFIDTQRSPNSVIIKADHKPLLDFFRERGEDQNHASASTTRGKCNHEFEHELLSKVAEDWLSGKPREMVLGWEVLKDGREVYLRDMEKGWKWRTLVEEKEVALDTEVEIWTCLLNELVLDLFPTEKNDEHFLINRV